MYWSSRYETLSFLEVNARSRTRSRNSATMWWRLQEIRLQIHPSQLERCRAVDPRIRGRVVKEAVRAEPRCCGSTLTLRSVRAERMPWFR